MTRFLGQGISSSGSGSPRISRRQAGKKVFSAAVIGPGALANSWPRRRRRTTLRVLGTHVTLQPLLRERAARELDLDLQFFPGGSAAVLQQASTRPESFDVFEQWSNTIPLLWQAGAIRPIETSRIDRWSEIHALAKTGRLRPEDRLGRGDAPHRLLHVQEDKSLGSEPSALASFLPYVHNVDSFGYSLKAVPEGEPYKTESWGWLLDERWSGRVALVNEPTIGLFDAALAAQATGLVSFKDIGAISREELDRLFTVLIKKKSEGHFYGAWNTVPESAKLMTSGQVVLQSMFSPGVALVRQEGHPIHYAAPKEGYRAWQGVMCMSSMVSEEVEDAAYRYMNWWLSGWPGAVMARQGYYMSVAEPVKQHLTKDEWGYWYGGSPASGNLPGADGRTSIMKGHRRRGGSYERRFSNIAVWNTVMDTYEYSMLRWYEFLTA